MVKGGRSWVVDAALGELGRNVIKKRGWVEEKNKGRVRRSGCVRDALSGKAKKM